MALVTLGHTGLQVSRLALGTMHLGAEGWRPWVLGEADARPIFRRAFDLGLNFIDTADTYSAGEAEKLVGKLVREHGHRDELVIASKVYNPVSPEFKSGQDLASLERARRPNGQGLSRKRLFNAIDASLSRLGLDHLDLWQIHRWDYATPVEEFMEALHDIVKSGKVRYLGASSMWAWQFAKAQHVAERHGWTKFVSMQNHYNLAYREEEREMLPLLRDQGVACIPWSPLARGFLCDDPDAPNTDGSANTRRAVDPLRKQYYSEPSDRAVAEAVGRVAKSRGVTRAQVAVAWLLSPLSASGGITAPIVGPQSAAELDELFSGTQLSLSADEVKCLEAPYLPKRILGHF